MENIEGTHNTAAPDLEEETGELVTSPSTRWLAWEGKSQRLVGRRLADKARRLKPSLEGIESLLEESAARQLSDPGDAKALAELAADWAVELLLGPAGDVYLARAFYLSANTSRHLGKLADAELALAYVVYHLAPDPESLDHAFYCRALALLRWGQGRLDEAGALLVHALLSFGEGASSHTEAAEERGTTWALVGLLELEQGREDRAQVSLTAALDAMNLDRRPGLTVRACLALALVLASREAPDSALAVLQEVWRLSPQITDAREKVRLRWWEGRVRARLGDEPEAESLLGSARRSYLEQACLPEAALVTLDAMVFLAEAGRPAEACAQAEELMTLLGKHGRADLAVLAAWELRRKIEAGRQDLRGCAVARAVSLRRSLRCQGFRIDSLPFV